MKIKYILLIAILFVGCSHSKTKIGTDNVDNYLSDKYIKGSVVCYTDTVWEVEDVFGELVRTGIHSLSKNEINELGNITKKTSYKSDGKLDKIYNYEYSNGKLSKINAISDNETETTTYYRTNGEIDSIYTLTKTSKDEIIVKDIYEKIEDKVFTIHTFDDLAGNYKYVYYYDEKNKLLKTVNDITKKVDYECIYRDGLLIEEITYIREFTVKDEYKYEFDDKGSCIKIEHYRVNDKGIRNIVDITTRNIQYR